MLEALDLDEQTLQDLLAVLPSLPEEEKRTLLRDLERLEELKTREKCQDDFLTFVQRMWPGFISGRHHKIMARAFERVARGEIKRLIINMPPRHTKSEFASYLLPAWFLGKFPEKKVIQTSHTAELAVNFGRKVRNLVDEEGYRNIFPETVLQVDSKAAGRWNTSKGGDYFAIGVGGAVTGKGADLLIIDDPHSEQEATIAETNPEVYDKTYEWYTSGPRQRLQPGGAIVVVMCMVGDTNVLMADGVEKPLRDIRPGDRVATYEDGKITTATVTNWRSNGVDEVFTVQTQSGKLLTANERHPFLVEIDGERRWIRLKDLKPGMPLVSTRDATGHLDLKRTPACATLAKQEKPITAKTPMPLTNLLGFMGSGKVRRALKKTAENLFTARGYALSATASGIGHQVEGVRLQPLNAGIESSPDMASLRRSMMRWSQSVGTAAMSVGNYLQTKTPALIGTENFVSTTITTPGKFGDSCVTTAISWSDTAKPPMPCGEALNTYCVTLDVITSITPSGRKEVFDVEIERTENFIANGVVSHNTRWSKRDLTAQVLKAAALRDGEEWEVIDFPAIMPSGNPLWPEFWPLEELAVLRQELPHAKWMAQYMQDPTSEASAIVKREWWQVWEKEDPPQCEFVLMSWDTAFEKNNRADYSACTTWGVFYRDDDGSDWEVSKADRGKPQAHIILLNAFRDRMEFPELKRVVIEQYRSWEPDGVIIEKKASGAPLIYELRAMGIPVQEFTPSKGNDKISRLNAVSDIFASGRVWVPETRWAEEVIEEVASFPAGDHDDYVDSVSMALMRFRQGGYIRTTLDEPDEDILLRYRNPNKKPYY
jgi:predicted phage terminase large subunit-like protein